MLSPANMLGNAERDKPHAGSNSVMAESVSQKPIASGCNDGVISPALPRAEDRDMTEGSGFGGGGGSSSAAVLGCCAGAHKTGGALLASVLLGPAAHRPSWPGADRRTPSSRRAARFRSGRRRFSPPRRRR